MLSKKAVAYLNCDSAVSGVYFKAAATPSLSTLLRSVASKIIDPTTKRPIIHRWSGEIETLGSGSDYTVFLDHLGIISSDISSTVDPVAPYG